MGKIWIRDGNSDAQCSERQVKRSGVIMKKIGIISCMSMAVMVSAILIAVPLC